MKKVFLILLIAILSVNSVFSFDLTDSQGQEKSYFSLSNPTIFVKTTENLTNFTITYTLSQEIVKEIAFVSCNSSYCAEVSLLELITQQNESLPELTTYIVNVNNQTKEVYLDSKTPEVSFSNSSLNSSSKVLTLNFNYSDNSEKIAKVELFEEVNSQNVLLKEVSNLTSYDYTVSSIGNKVFVLKVTDLAQNTKEQRQAFAVEDIFGPQISTYTIIKRDDKINLYFKITDEHIQKYEISQNNLTLSEIVSGATVEKTIVLPFSSGNILFKVHDQNSNVVEKTISLDSSITYKQNSIYSNKKVFEITSNANDCTLVKFDSKDLNQKFEKSASTFSTSVDVNEVKSYNLEFYCELTNYKEYFKTTFYYDNIAPSEVVLNVTKEEDGNLRLSWIGGVDNSSAVVFNLFRDSNKIYTGSKSNYVDKDVEYPNVYEYYIEAVDAANNYVKSNKVEEIPKKVKINFEINLKKEQKVTDSNFTLNMKIEENSNVSLFIKNQKSILYEKSFENTTGDLISLDIMFEEGINEINIEIFDDFNNTLRQTYFVTYEIFIPEEKVIEEAVISEKTTDAYKVTINENITNILVPDTAQKMAQNIVSDISSIFMKEEEKVVEEPILSYAKIGLFLIFIIFAVLIWNYLFNEDKLRQKVKDLRYIKESNHMDFFRKKDSSLGSSLEKIKEERKNKQITRLIEEEKKKKISTKVMTDYEKQKYSDISKRDRISDRIIGTDNRKTIEEKPKKKEPEFISEDELMEKHDKKQPESKSNFFSWFDKKQKKEDSFLDYIQKEKTKKSWNSKTDFVFKEEKKPEVTETKVEPKIESKENLSLDKNINTQNIKKDESQIKKEEVKEETKNNNLNKKEIDRKHMLDDYLGKVISKRRSFFAEKEVNKDIFKRQEK